jgi:oleandomycin transport system ATP-binding protein
MERVQAAAATKDRILMSRPPSHSRSAAEAAPANATIEVAGLVKSFDETRALDGVDLSVPAGSILGLLGPNGAGKTTLVRVLATLLRPDAGSGRVGGHDVVLESEAVRAQLGLTGQFAAVDDDLTGRENLEFIGRLSQLSRSEARSRASELLDRFELSDAADRRASEYSGGMARRLDLAASLVARPRVVFLDEPTTGLDPSSRRALWGVIRELVAEGTTVLLTTQYLDEADQLSDEIAVIDRGRLIASGAPAELKKRVGGQVLELRPAVRQELRRAAEALEGLGDRPPEVRDDPSDGAVVVAVDERTSRVAGAIRRLDDAGIELEDMALKSPTLDDVFFALTGSAPAERDAPDQGTEREEER